MAREGQVPTREFRFQLPEKLSADPICLPEASWCATMRKYQMRVYGPGGQEPRLLQTYDIIADTDALARAMAWRRYDKLIRELAGTGAQPISALRALTLHFSLSEGDRLVFESARKEDAR